MDIFDIPDDYKPEKPLTSEEMNEITEYLKAHPLFLKEIPENIQDNPHLVALQSLVADEPAEQEALHLNKQASLRLNEKPESPYHMKEAYSKYTEAINLNCNDKCLNAKLHSNRAAINLKLKNYAKVVQDCKIAIKLDPAYSKAYYRYGKALIALSKFEECLKMLSECQNEELDDIRKEAEEKMKKESAMLMGKQTQKKEKNQQIEAYFQKRNWKLASRPEPLPENVHIEITAGVVSVPLVIIYPEFSQFDLIARTHPSQKIQTHIEELLKDPLPWDAAKDYTINQVDMYAEIAEGVLLRVPRQAKLQEIYARVVIREAMELHVVSKGNKFYQQYISAHKIV